MCSWIAKRPKKDGFRQGHFNDHLEFFSADCSRLLMARMNYGEIVPWMNLIDERNVEVDTNFSVGYKPNSNNDIIRKLLESY